MSEKDTPKGTWSSGEMPAVRLTADVVPMRPAQDTATQGSDSQVTPLPTSPLALASDTPQLRADATGSRPRPPKTGGDVVPIRPEEDAGVSQSGTRGTSSERRLDHGEAPPTENAESSSAESSDVEKPAAHDEVDPAAATEPPFLASRSLAEDLAPREPARKTLQRLGVTLGVLGGAGALLVGGTSTSALAAAGGLFVLAMIAALPLGYEVRAWAVTGLSVTGLGFFSAGLQMRGERLDESLLAVAVFVLGAGLLFRAYHRASRVARLVVLTGILGVGGYLFLSGGLGAITHLDAAWQSWAPVVPRILLGLLGLTAVLAFMDASSTAGGAIWATLLFLVFAAHVAVREAVALFPSAGLGRSRSLPDAHLGQSLAIVVVVIAGSIALAQLLAASAAKRQRSPRH